MSRARPHSPLSPRDKLVVSGVLLVICLAFGTLVIFSLTRIGAELTGWFAARSWHSGPAQLEEVHLRRSGRKGGPRFISVRYRYLVDDNAFEGHRMGWNDSTWSGFSDWAENRRDELLETSNHGRPLLVWFDPASPGTSVIDRGIRWGLLVFLLALGLAGSAVSLATGWLLRNLWRPG